MASDRASRALASRRRRSEGDEEDHDSIDAADDTQSELSVASDLDGDADASDTSNLDASAPDLHRRGSDSVNGLSTVAGAGFGERRANKKGQPRSLEAPASLGRPSGEGRRRDSSPSAVSDVLVEHSGAAPLPESQMPDSQPGLGRRSLTMADRRRREHEEYKKKRDTDPTFIPNRGGFFMHDARIPDQRGFSQFGRGRGRGRGAPGAPAAPVPYVIVFLLLTRLSPQRLINSTRSQTAPPDHPVDTNWKHDLHETINEPHAPTKMDMVHETAVASNMAPGGNASVPPRPLNFSRTTHKGKVQIRVLLPGAKAPILFSDVPVKSHARLPDHRPPLRRDKPVRISLPDTPPRYQFPSSDRSFIFIPRAMRPNQQGFGRARGSFGAYAGPASRRTSMYGGSVHSLSVTMSRRSSLAREVPRDNAFSPTGSYGGAQSGRPVVRLPHAGSHQSSEGSPAPSVTAYPRGQSYPLPQKPAVEHWAQPETMYQPRPQKTISVTGIEAPADLGLHAPQQQGQQPFHSQLPQHMGGIGIPAQHSSSEASQAPYFPQPFAISQATGSNGTPLSNIPERAIHAQPFQPLPAFYSQQYPGQGYYYAGQATQYPEMVGYPIEQGYAAGDGSTTGGNGAALDASQQAQGGMVAYETNGMVYYQDAGQGAGYGQQGGYYQAPVFGMGGMMTPGPESNYYHSQVGQVYYPQS